MKEYRASAKIRYHRHTETSIPLYIKRKKKHWPSNEVMGSWSRKILNVLKED